MILYFSGTGNSKYVAELIASVTGDCVVSLNNCIKNNKKEEFSSTLPFVFVTPTYAWRTPKIVSEYLANAKFTGNDKYYFIQTCGDSVGLSKQYVEKIFLPKGMQILGFGKIVMPENYIAMYDAPDADTAKKIIADARPKIESYAEWIKEEKSFSVNDEKVIEKIYSKIVNPLFYAMFVKADRFYTTDKCIGCGKCVSLCPLNNIKLVNKKPVWGHKCTHCMACICKCPKEAIEYEGQSEKRYRYFIEGYSKE